MLRWLVVLVMLTTTPELAAQVIPVRAGEHDTFTRLTLQIPEGAVWQLATSARRAVVSLSLEDPVFDTSGVFSRVPRTRLLKIENGSAGAELALSLGCECETRAFVQNRSLLVIDILDPEKPGDNRVQWRRLRDRFPYRFAGTALPGPSAQDAGHELHLPDGIVGRRVAFEFAESAVADDPKPEISLPSSLSEERLLRQLRRSVEQGLLTPVNPERTGEITDEEPDPDPVAPPINLTAITVIDRDMQGIANQIAQEPTIICLENEELAVDQWASDSPFGEQISSLRSRLYGEFDDLDIEAARDLARAYLHFGFGVEARQMLDLTRSERSPESVLMAMTYLVGGQKIPGKNPFAGQMHCDGDVALWAALAAGDLSENVNSSSVLRAFVRLPSHLRSLVGPELAKTFVKQGDGVTADTMLRGIRRTTPDPDGSVLLAEAEISDLNGEPERANRKRQEVIASDDPNSPEALLSLVESGWRDQKGLRPEIPDLIASYAKEFRAVEMGVRLRGAHVLSLALAGDFPKAFRVFDGYRHSYPDDSPENTLVPLMTIVTRQADDVDFLIFVASGRTSNMPLPLEIADSVASRLLSLGFPEIALPVLMVQGAQPASAERRLLRARTHLELGQYHNAYVDLLGLDGVRADRLRAELLELNGENYLAAPIYRQTKDEARALRALWQAGDAGAEFSPDVPRYGKAMEMTRKLAQAGSPNRSLPPLAAARHLVETSIETRSDVRSLLETLPLTPLAE